MPPKEVSQDLLVQSFHKHDKDKDGKITVMEAVQVFRALLEKTYYHGIISNRMRVLHPNIENPILIDLQSFKKIYEALIVVDPFERHIVEFKQSLNSLLQQQIGDDDLDLTPKDRGTDNRFKILYGPERQNYSNRIFLKAKKHDKNLFKQSPSTTIRISFKTGETKAFKQIFDEILSGGKDFLVQASPDTKLLAECLIFETSIDQQKSTVNVKIEASNQELRDLQEVLNEFLDKLFKTSVMLRAQFDFQFQNSPLSCLKEAQPQHPSIQYTLLQNSKLQIQIQANEVISSLKEYSRALSLFDDFQYDRFYPISSFLLFILSCESGSGEIEFDNLEKEKVLKGEQNVFGEESKGALFMAEQQMRQGLMQFIQLVSQVPQFGILKLLKMVDKEIKIEAEVACFQVKFQLKLQDFAEAFEMQGGDEESYSDSD